MDHSSGTRTYVAEGAEIVMPAQARPFFEKMFQAEHKLSPDALAQQPKPAKIVDVKDALSLKDETVTINLYNIPNPHSDGMIIGHLVGPNLVWVTDLISPRGPIGRSPATVAVGDALRKAGISGSDDRGRSRHHRQAGGDHRRVGGELGDDPNIATAAFGDNPGAAVSQQMARIVMLASSPLSGGASTKPAMSRAATSRSNTAGRRVSTTDCQH
jgi:hypothetical protein